MLQDDAEKELFAALQALSPQIKPFCEKGAYADALKKLAELREAVDRFFEQVMVMADDQKVRNNRLALLQSLQAEFSQVADIAMLQG